MPIHGYPGGVISATAPTISPTSASGVWTLDDQLQNAANWPSQSNIARSLRFNSADSAYLNRTPASAGNRKTWTWSGWVKRSALGSTENIFTASDASGINEAAIYFGISNQLLVYSYISAYQLSLKTTQVFRDVGSWGHLLIAVDTTQATSTNRAKIYWNGVQITDFETATYPSQNYDTYVNTTQPHYISRDPNPGAGGRYLNAYLADVYFIDGQALTPSSFGYTDSNGIWQPNSYTGSYGTNGFWLNFDDNSGTTATTLGKDSSGNGNNWTPNNFSVTAGTGNDSLVDSPSNYGTDTGVGGEVRGNYCTLNPLKNTATLSNGNLNSANAGTSGFYTSYANMSMDSGKYYWEIVATDDGVNARYAGFGIADPSVALTGITNSALTGSQAANSRGWTQAIRSSISAYGTGLYNNGGTVNSTTRATTSGTRIFMVAYNADTGKCWMGYEGTWWTGDPAAGTSEYFTATAPMVPVINPYNDGSNSTLIGSVNFGQRPFAYTAPAGFKALCSTNLPTPTIQKGASYFNPVLYTGTGSTQSITGVGFQPDWVWIKKRSGAESHALSDVLRGTNNILISDSTAGDNTASGTLTAFGSDGFTVGAQGIVNDNTFTYVAWNWKAGGTGVSNTSGSITSTVSANQTAGFSIVTYTGTGANATVGHGLGAAPSMVIVKNRTDGTRDWLVYHASIGNTASLFLNLTNASTALSAYWNNTSPTSSVFSLGNSSAGNGSTNNLVAYCFAAVSGYSAFGSYTGNGSADGPFVYTGFRPAYVLIKCSSVGAANRPWVIKDKLRAAEYNPQTGNLYTNLSNAEDVEPSVYIDFLSNGFKIRGTYAGVNASSDTYIYAAFAESPFKISRAR